MSLLNVLKIQEIALLLVPDEFSLALGKIRNAHPLPASPFSPLQPQIKCWDLMGLSLIARGT